MSDALVLVLSQSPQVRGLCRKILSDGAITVLYRITRERTLHILGISEVSCIICDQQLDDGTALELLKEIRETDSPYQDVPFYALIPADDKAQEQGLALFAAGADEVSTHPMAADELRARALRLLRWRQLQRANNVKLSTRAESREVPGIFQYLEAEKSTGTMRAYHHHDKAQVSFHEGRVVLAQSEFCTGKDAIVEIMAWPFCQIRFVNEALTASAEQLAAAQNTSSLLMDCVLDVDNYNAVLARLDDPEMTFEPGEQALPQNANRIARRIVQLSAAGLALEEMLATVNINRRHIYLLIDQLLRAGFIRRAAPSFAHYEQEASASCQRNRAYLAKHLFPIAERLAELLPPLPLDIKQVPFASHERLESVTATVILHGDSHEVAQQIFDTLLSLGAAASGMRSQVKSRHAHESRTRIFLSPALSLDLIRIPPRADAVYIRELASEIQELVGVLFCVSSLDKASCYENRRRLRLLREQFKLPMAALCVPLVNAGQELITIECHSCTHKLTFDPDSAGAEAACPICSTHVIVPDPQQWMQEQLHLPQEITWAYVRSDDSTALRHGLGLFIDDIRSFAGLART